MANFKPVDNGRKMGYNYGKFILHNFGGVSTAKDVEAFLPNGYRSYDFLPVPNGTADMIKTKNCVTGK